MHTILTEADSVSTRDLLSKLQLDGLPPRDRVYRAIEEKILLPRTRLPDHWLPTYQVHWEHKLEIPSLLCNEPSSPPTTLSFVRTGLEGRVTGCVEVPVTQQHTGLTSTSLDRAPAPLESFVRGKSGHVPFWPGGLDEALVPLNENGATPSGLRTVPPGFRRGLLGGDGEADATEVLDVDENQDFSRQRDKEIAEHLPEPQKELISGDLPGVSEIDDLLPTSRSQLRPVVPVSKPLRRTAVQKREWAHIVDVKKPMTNFHELVPEMAHKYPFELDTFQKEAVYHLEMGDSVFVAAHTSAGKTVVAEYAIALAAKHMTRAIYTSPIKALSNQKFRDFKQTFSSSSVGILTGDVQINPEANCLIMTTEILRSMLYKGADLIRDVEFVIFDEVHYVNDAERGVVWEEVIIMLPEHVSIILLSATVPNTKEFADWVGRTKKKDIYVISTPARPVPLEHYLYSGRETFKIVDSKGQFLAPGYKDAGEALRRKQDKERESAGLPPVQRLGARAAAPQRGTRGGFRGRSAPSFARGGVPGGSRTIHGDRNLYVHLVGYLRKHNLLPVVIFTFSKKRCEDNAATLTNVDLSSAGERSEIHIAIEKALTRLKGSDKKLPQIGRMRDLLSRGIGVHHGGLLPIVKEVVEILFARGLVKVLFATETFAMGVNMPAKCVVFSGIRKHDGKSFRFLEPGEYTQMAGRAGRRGLDTTGTVIITAGDELPEITTLHTMILGTPTRLQSQFRLTYNMILNLLRVEALKVEEMIKRSFSENASQKLLPDQQRKVLENEKLLSTLPKLDCEICLSDISLFYNTSAQIVDLNLSMLTLAAASPQSSKIITQGRVVILRDDHFRNNVAVVLKVGPPQENMKTFFVLVLSNKETKGRKIDPNAQPVPPIWPPDVASLVIDDFVYEFAAIPLSSISLVTNRTLKADYDQIERAKITAMNNAVAALNEIAKEWASLGNVPEVDWSRLRALEFQEALRSRNELAQKLNDKACLLCGSFKDHYATLHGEMTLRVNIENLKMAISDQNLELIPDYEQRISVLQELKFIDANSTVLLKGRVACEINSADELILTEVILENMLAGYEPEEVVALLSCFVFQEKTDVEPVLTPRLEEGRAALLEVAERVGEVQVRHRVSAPDAETSLKFGLVEVVYEWANGMPFEQIMMLTHVAEGTIVRVITRLDETCREVRDAARVIGDASLMKKMEDAQIRIKRDIVFAASLYF